MAQNTINLSQQGLGSLAQSIDKLVVSMNQLEASVDRLAKNNASAFQRVFGTTKDLNAIVQAIRNLNTQGVAAFDQLSKSLRSTLYFMTQISGQAVDTKKITDLVAAITSLTNINFDPNKVSGLKTLQTTITNIVKIFTDPKFQQLTKAQNNDLAKTIGDIVKTLMELPAVVNSLPGIGSLEIISKIFAALGRGLVSMSKAANDISKGDIAKLAAIFGSLATIFKLIASVTNNLPGSTQLGDLAKTFQKLGSGLASLSTVSRTVNTKVVGQLTTVFAKLVASFKLMALVLSLLPGGKALDSFATTIKNLGDGLRSLGTLGRDIRLDVNLFSAVQDFIQLLKPFFLSLKGFRNTDLPDFGAVLPPILTAFENLSGRKFDKVDVKPLKQFMEGLADSLNSFGRVKVDAGQLNAVARLLQNLFDGAGKFSQTSGTSLGEGFSSSITAGFVKGLQIDRAVQFVFENIGKIIAKFNPVTLFTAISHQIAVFIDGAIAKVKELGSSLTTMGSTLRSFGTNLFGSLGLGGVGNSNAFKLAEDFDALSTQVKVFGNLTEDQTKKAQAFANEIGIKYPQSANDALQGILNLQKAGLDLNQIFTTLPSAADLASVSDTKDLNAASQALIQVTQSFKDFAPGVKSGFENAAVASDILARTANLSTASVESLVEGLANVGPVATTFGLDLQETSAALALFQDSGIRGAEAGTQLKSLLTNLTSGSAESKKALKDLGVTIVDENGNYKDLNTIINDLNKAMNDTKTVTVSTAHLTADQKTRLDAAKKAYAAAARQITIYGDSLSTSSLNEKDAAKKLNQLQQVQQNAQKVIAEITGSQSDTEKITKEITRTQAQNATAIKALAGSYGQAGLAILINAGNDAIKDFIEQTGRLPTAAEQAALLLNNMKGDAEQLKGSLETLLVRGFLPLIGKAFRPLIQLGRTVVDFFNSLPDPVFDIASNVILLVSGLASLVSGFSIAAGIALTFSGALVSGIGVLLSIATNMGLVIAGAATLAASFATLIVVGTAIVGVVTAIGTGISFLTNLIATNAGGAGDAFNKLRDNLNGILDSVGQIIRTGGDIIGFLFGDSLNDNNVERGRQLANFFTRISNSLFLIRSNVGNVANVVSTFKDFLHLATGTNSRTTFFNDFISQGFAVDDAITMADDKVKDLTDTMQKSAGLIGQGWLIRTIFGHALTGDQVLGLFDQVKSGLFTIRDAAVNVFKGLSGLLLGSLGLDNSPAAQDALKRGLSSFGTLITQGLQKLTGLDLTSSLLQFKDNDVAAGARSLVSSLLTSLKKLLINNKTKIQDIASAVFNFLLPGSTFGPAILKSLGLTDLGDALQKVFDTINSIFRNGVGALFDVLNGENLEDALIGNFGPGIIPVINAVKALGRAIGRVANVFASLFSVLFPSGNADGPSFLESFFNGLAGVFNTIGDISTVLAPALTFIIRFAKNLFAFATKSPLIARIAGVIGLLVGGLGALTIASKGSIGLSTITDIFSKLSGLLTPLIVPLLAIGGAVVGLKSFFEALAEGGDIVQVVKRTFGNFVSTLASLVGLQLDSSQVVDFINNLGSEVTRLAATIPDALDSLGTLISAPLLNTVADALRTGDFQPVLDNVVAGIKSIFDTATTGLFNFGTAVSSPLIENIATALKTGDFTSVASGIFNTISDSISKVPVVISELGAALSAPILTQLGVSLSNGDFNPFFTMLSSGIQQGIITAGSSIEKIGRDIGAPLITQIGIAMQTGDYSPIFQSIVDGIHSVQDQIPTLFHGLADILGAPTLDALAEGLRTGDATQILNAVVDTVVNAVKSAIGVIPDKIKELGTTLNLSFLTDFGVSLGDSAAFKVIGDVISQLLADIGSIGADTVGGIVDIFRGIKEAMSGENPQAAKNIRELANALGVIAGLFVAVEVVTNFGAFVGFMGTLLSTGLGAVASVAGVGAALLVIKDAIQGLGEIFSGKKDIGTAIGDFFFNIGKDALGLFGINKVFGVDIDTIKTTWDQLFTIIKAVLDRLAQVFVDTYRQIFDGLQVRAALIQAQINIASPDEATRTMAGAFFAENDILGQADFTKSFEALEGAFATGYNASIIKAAARLNFDPILAKFHENINNLAELSDHDFAGMIAALASSDSLDEAIASIPSDALAPFMQRLLTVDPATLKLLDFGQISTTLENAVKSGSINIDLASAFLFKIPETVLPKDKRDEFIAKLRAELAGGDGTAPATGGGFGGVQTTVPLAVTPTAVVSDDKKSSFFTDVQKALQESQPTDTTPVEVPTSVTPITTLDAAGITTPESAQAMADNLLLVQQQADLTVPSLSALTGASVVLSSILSTLVNSSLANVKSTIEKLSVATVNLAIQVPISMGVIGIAFAIGANVAANALNPLLTKLDQVKTKINEIAAALDALKNGGADAGTGGVNVTPTGKRKEGGNVFAGGLYEVAEDGISELLRIGGRTFLIPGQNGMVIPPVTPPVQSPRGGNSVVNNSSADNSIGNVSIIIQGGTNLTQEQLRDGVSKGLKDYQRNNPLNRRLVLAGKT